MQAAWLLAAVGFAWTARAGTVPLALCALSLVAIGLWSTMGPFWALMTRMVGGAAAAGSVAMITMIGGFGGFFGPYVTGRLRDATYSFSGGLYLIAGLALGALRVEPRCAKVDAGKSFVNLHAVKED